MIKLYMIIKQMIIFLHSFKFLKYEFDNTSGLGFPIFGCECDICKPELREIR